MITTGILTTLISLFMIHRRQRDKEREKRVQYWREQVGNYIQYFALLTT